MVFNNPYFTGFFECFSVGLDGYARHLRILVIY